MAQVIAIGDAVNEEERKAIAWLKEKLPDEEIEKINWLREMMEIFGSRIKENMDGSEN